MIDLGTNCSLCGAVVERGTMITHYRTTHNIDSLEEMFYKQIGHVYLESLPSDAASTLTRVTRDSCARDQGATRPHA